jgi:hypothetical protein
MTKVTKEQFYKIIFDKKLDVHPSPLGAWVRGKGYLTHWKYRNGQLFGVSFGQDYQITA